MLDNFKGLRAYYRTKRVFQAGAAYLPWIRRRLRRNLERQHFQELVRTESDLLVRVDSREPATFNVLVRGIINSELEWVIRRYVKPGTAAIDVGANIGLVSVLIGARIGEEGMVYAVEPNPRLHPRIRELFRLNAMHNLRLCPCACSQKPAKAKFSVDQHDHCKSKISDKGDIEIELMTIDGILKDEPRPVSFLKIDVEGHEPMVLAGARETLRHHRPTLVLETGTHTAADIDSLNVLLDEVGYDVLGVIHEWGIEERPLSTDITTRTHCDVIALPREP